ncbi:MAG: alanine/ornithine racemase family PLP-dependent enzyme [Thermoplasmatota archaeon]
MNEDAFPRIVVDREKLEHNARTIVELASRSHIEITGVTKACRGDPRVAKAMLDGGAASLADSRIENIIRMRRAGITADMMLLRTPMLSQAGIVVEHADISLNTEPAVIKALSREAAQRDIVHRVLLMAELGERREGIPQEELHQAVTLTLSLDSLELHGLGLNLTCLTGVIPTRDKMLAFEKLVQDIQDTFGIELAMVGAGNSANIPLMLQGDHPAALINNLRVGEGILLGLETISREPIPGTHQDAFTIEAELIEVKDKPSVPDGELTQNAYGETPSFENRGVITRGIAALGRQDVITEGLTPLDDHVDILAGSSDHLVLHLRQGGYEVGDIVRFRPNYGALVAAYTSEYVGAAYK